MPEVGDFSRHLQAVDTQVLQRSNLGWASRCPCGLGVKSEFYNGCLECRDQDVKPGEKALVLDPSFWGRAAEIPAASIADDDTIPFGQPSNRVTRARAAPSDDSPNSRDHLVHGRSPRRSPSSPYRTLYSQRGRPPNGSRQGPKGFKGVRQRKGVRGFLVEIRPPKWKRTIWLGTYNTDREAAGAYDAGIFYTNKKTMYNFPNLKGTFPVLPAQLRLDNPDDSDEIKAFVQREAREAARKVKSLPPPAETSATSTVTTQNTAAASATSSSEESSAEQREPGNNIVIPFDDLEWLEWPRGYSEVPPSLFEDLMGNANFQQAASWHMATVFELKQEEIALAALDCVNGGLM